MYSYKRNEQNNIMSQGLQTQGLRHMHYIHPDFKTKKVLTYVANLIIDYNYQTYDDLSEGDKNEFTSLLIEAAGKDGEYEFLVEHPSSNDLIASFRKCLVLGTKENNESFLELAKAHAIEYYDYLMKALFEYVLRDYQLERNEWLDRMAKEGDPDTAYDQYRDSL